MGATVASPPLVWIDLEMSGLDPRTCRILEIATLVTDGELKTIAEGPNLVVHQSDVVLDAMDTWCTDQHAASGLSAAVRASTISTSEAEAQTIAFLSEHAEPGSSPLCGNSVGHDRRFLIEYMAELERFLHYRIVDVSTIKELARRWSPGLVAPPKRESHRALDDIRESIEELRFYREQLFAK
jgi:oligoribonuclease